MINESCETRDLTHIRNSKSIGDSSHNYSQKYLNLSRANQPKVESNISHAKNISSLGRRNKLTAQCNKHYIDAKPFNLCFQTKFKKPVKASIGMSASSEDCILPDVTNFLKKVTKALKPKGSDTPLVTRNTMQEEPLCQIDNLRRAIKLNKIRAKILKDLSDSAQISTSQCETFCTQSKINIIPRTTHREPKREFTIPSSISYPSSKVSKNTVINFSNHKENIPRKSSYKPFPEKQYYHSAMSKNRVAELEIDDKGLSPWKTHEHSGYIHEFII